MTERSNISIESWVLMSLIYRDLDDGDYRNALLLAERLYALDNQNKYYKLLYADCLFHCLDYTASYTILKSVKSIPCLNLFAKSCLELGNTEKLPEKQRELWEEGVQSLQLALSLPEIPQTIHWGDELSSMTVRNHMPSRSSICNLLGDLYVKLDNIRLAATYYWDCLLNNPYKISAYIKLCEIAPDVVDFNKTKLPKDIFVDLDPAVINLSRSSLSYLPPFPSANISDISFSNDLPPSSIKKNGCSMPEIHGDYHDFSIDQLRALVTVSSKIVLDHDKLPEHEYERDEIENRKDTIITDIENDIKRMEANEAFKNKHGLHRKPPIPKPQKLTVELETINENEEQSDHDKVIYDSIQNNAPPRLLNSSRRRPSDTPAKSNRPVKKRGIIKDSTEKAQSISSYFLPLLNVPETDQVGDREIVEGMNKVIKALCILANGYFYQSFHHCEKAALELQKLDDRQYNSPRVLGILGIAYYDAGDYLSARAFFRQAFLISPWYCDYIPIYSTCLWYLEKEEELNLLAFKMKENRSHQFEAYIAAGNWAKCVKGGNEAVQWFQKAVDLDPSRSYGHALLGYEEWEKGNSLGAKKHFANSMITDKRSYLGWYGMASAYQAMEEYMQARTLLAEAVRLHPRHPVVLSTMAEVLYELEEYEEAKEYIDKSLSIKTSTANEKLKSKIETSLIETRNNANTIDNDLYI
ncbi:uncharacterized protein BX663DRAFT_506150 [Cokeromyces recurvatus]|uniref:uncharacterized protein n=1 Tax=Cokeromyces recurvatus TaxID=90255 RepID=UPI00221F1AD0|nr:uncharacterized protein BX663DRAFT_506150 [Cokeromyces recurvatus]KAI7904030.1 hypothetical protein BX663DRAFT_506150 [Cokeromyces recurvatus]